MFMGPYVSQNSFRIAYAQNFEDHWYKELGNHLKQFKLFIKKI